MVKILKISGKTSDSEIHNRVDLVQIKLHNLSIVSINVCIEILHRVRSVYVFRCVYYFVFIQSNFAFAVLISSWSRPQDLKSSDTWKNHAHSPSLHQMCSSVRRSVYQLTIQFRNVVRHRDFESFECILSWYALLSERITYMECHRVIYRHNLIKRSWSPLLLYSSMHTCSNNMRKKSCLKNANKNFKYFHSELRFCRFIVN